MSLDEAKRALRRKAARRRRDAAGRAATESAATPSKALAGVLARYRGVPIAGYHPIGTEIDPLPALAEAAAHGPVGLPVVEGPARPLGFRLWHPGAAMEPGAHGALIPAAAEPMTPEVLVVPLLAFDRRGGRLGYGGGYYDRTLTALRRSGTALAIGFAYAAQEVGRVPMGDTDVRLDMVVTETGVMDIGQG